MAYKKIDPEFKAKWVKALRSGRYKQGREQLRGDAEDGKGQYEYCCLGVACNVISRKRWAVDGCDVSDFSGDHVGQYRWGEIGGTQTERFPFLSDAAARKLSKMNDAVSDDFDYVYKHKYTFNDIASWIEKYL